MDYKILRPVSNALSMIIPTEELQKEIGLKALADIPTFENYLKATDRVNLLTDLFEKNEGYFIINDDEFTNDHIIVGIKSPLIENENNILFFLLPSVTSYEQETLEEIEQMKALLTLPSDKDSFQERYDICFVMCKIVQLSIEKSMTDNNLN